MDNKLADHTKRMIQKDTTRETQGLKRIDWNKPYSQIRTAAGVIGLDQGGVTFDLDGYERTKPLPDVA